MLAKNHVELRGFVATDPEIREASGGLLVGTFRIAVTQPVSAEKRAANRTAGKQDPADFFNVRMYNDDATTMQRSGLAKGDLVSVEGRLCTDRWNGPQGEYHERTFVNVSGMGRALDILRRKNPTQAMAPDQAVEEADAVLEAAGLASTEDIEAAVKAAA